MTANINISGLFRTKKLNQLQISYEHDENGYENDPSQIYYLWAL